MKKHLQKLDKEAEYCNFDCFASQLIEGCNNLASKRSVNEADKWFDKQVKQVYKEERIYLVVTMHNAAMKKSMGVAYSGTADILFGRLCHLWFNY